MIKGHGIDIESIAAIEKAYQKNARFAEKVLTKSEQEHLGHYLEFLTLENQLVQFPYP